MVAKGLFFCTTRLYRPKADRFWGWGKNCGSEIVNLDKSFFYCAGRVSLKLFLEVFAAWEMTHKCLFSLWGRKRQFCVACGVDLWSMWEAWGRKGYVWGTWICCCFPLLSFFSVQANMVSKALPLAIPLYWSHCWLLSSLPHLHFSIPIPLNSFLPSESCICRGFRTELNLGTGCHSRWGQGPPFLLNCPL